MCSCIVKAAENGSSIVGNACPEEASLYMSKYTTKPIINEVFAQALGAAYSSSSCDASSITPSIPIPRFSPALHITRSEFSLRKKNGDAD